MTQPTIEQMLQFLTKQMSYCGTQEENTFDMLESIRAALTAQSANTLPLDEVPEGYSWESISSISRSGQVLFVLKSENKPMNVFSAYGTTLAEALRAAIAKVTK
mgnify:CR=1 FL=1